MTPLTWLLTGFILGILVGALISYASVLHGFLKAVKEDLEDDSP